MKKENKLNIPNTLCYIRIILSFVLIYFILKGYNPWTIVGVYCVAAITDGFDGWSARIFKQKTEFGRKLDMLADRILLGLVVLSYVYYLILNGLMTQDMITNLLLLTSREIISFPFFLFAVFYKVQIFTSAKKIGKLMTLMQGFAFPLLILNLAITPYFLVLTGAIGIGAGTYYAYDVMSIYKKNK